MLTKLSGPLAIYGRAGPVIGPGHIAVLAQSNHGFDGECHAGFALANGLVLGVVWNVGRAVEDCVDAVAHVRSDDATAFGLGVFLDRVAKLAEQGARLHQLYGLREALPRSFCHTDRVRVSLGLVTDIVCLGEGAVVALVIERYVEIDDVTVEEDALVGDSMADNFVDRCADRLGEVVVV